MDAHTRHDPTRKLRARRGAVLEARSWLTEAPLRMLHNNLDPEVAERPDELVVYGGIGRAARDWECFDQIVASLKCLGAEETLLIQSGKPVGVFRTHADAPRVLIANSNLVPHWATWEHFAELDRKGLMMFGQMTAGSWIYIGSQGIVQGTYETFVEMGRRHYGGDLAGRWILTAGLGGMGGAQPLAATMAGASMLAIECQPSRIQKRLDTGYLDVEAPSLDAALELIERSVRDRRPLSVGLCANAAEILPQLLLAQRAARCAHRSDLGARSGERLFAGRLDDRSVGVAARCPIPRQWRAPRSARWRSMSRRCSSFIVAACRRLTMAITSGRWRSTRACKDAFAFPGFVPAYIRPLFCRGVGPFRWVALSGDPEDIYRTDQKVKELIPDDPHLHRWLDMARARIKFQGLPARICWVGLGDRHRLGLAFNAMVASGELQAPIVIGRDHLDSGLGGEPESGDRGNARRLGCGLRLAAAECASEYGKRRHLGVFSSWRWRRHGLFAARRRRDRVRRHAGGGAAHRAGAVERSGDRRHASCGCGLSRGGALRPRARA